jgi:serine O-acetyltransferase
MVHQTPPGLSYETIRNAGSLWLEMTAVAEEICATEKTLLPAYTQRILRFSSFEKALAALICDSLKYAFSFRAPLRPIVETILEGESNVSQCAARDLAFSLENNPAYSSLPDVFLNSKGFLALTTHRVCHYLWHEDRRELASYIHGASCEVHAVDIHPAATFGAGILIDHATGLVVGETARIGDNVSIFHGVTLGGTGKETGDRHPKIGSGVLIGAQAMILGNITIGDDAKVGAGSVVLNAVPAGATVVGVPARIVSRANSSRRSSQARLRDLCGYETSAFLADCPHNS